MESAKEMAAREFDAALSAEFARERERDESNAALRTLEQARAEAVSAGMMLQQEIRELTQRAQRAEEDSIALEGEVARLRDTLAAKQDELVIRLAALSDIHKTEQLLRQ